MQLGYSKILPNQHYTHFIICFITYYIERAQNGMTKDCRTCQCTLRQKEIQSIFSDSQSTSPPSSFNGTIAFIIKTFYPSSSKLIAICTGILSTNTENEKDTTEPLTHQNSAPVTMCTSMSGSDEDSTHPHCRCEAAMGVLGSLVGLLLVLLAVVSISWAWTCWNMKKSIRYIQRPYYIMLYKGNFRGRKFCKFSSCVTTSESLNEILDRY